MVLETSEEGRSPIYDFGNENERTISMTYDRYEAGSGGPGLLQIRGQATVFLQNDVSPAWETYVGPVNKTWKFIQIRGTI